MFSTLIFLLAAVLAVFSSAASDDFQVTNLSISRVDGGNVTIKFTVHDPDPLGQETKSCGGTWKIASHGYPVGSYKACAGNTTFGWHMESYRSMEFFVLGLEHSYKDPSVGQPPYDQITNFAKTNLTLANHPCKVNKGQKVCAQKANTVIKAPIWGTIA